MSPLNTNPTGDHGSAREPLSPQVLAHTGPVDAWTRRRMLQVMGASMALATAAGCRFESEDIVPLQVRPAGRMPGKTRRFATSLECGGVAASLLVTSYDGRPIKIEGNPDHPLDAGAASARSQASVLDLYDPDHSSGLVQTADGVAWPRTWAEFDPWFAALAASLRTTGGAGLAILAESSSSLTLARERERARAVLPAMRWVEYESVSRREERAGAKLAFGRSVRTLLRLESARTLVCLDADLFGDHPASLAHARAWAARRDPASGKGLRTWTFEPSMTLTGACSDHRVPLRAEQVGPFLVALEHALHARDGAAYAAPNTARPQGGFLARPDVARALEQLAIEIASRRGECVIAVGPRQPAVVHALAHRLNARSGAVGRTLEYVDEPANAGLEGDDGLAQLVRDMSAGKVGTLVILGGNPVYDAPVDLDFRRALRNVPRSFHLSTHRDETSRECTWHLPRAHALETWGDARSWDGTVCLTQPLIDRLFERRTPVEMLTALAGPAAAPAASPSATPAVTPAFGTLAALRETVRAAVAPGASEDAWRRIVHDGFVRDSRSPAVTPELIDFAVPAFAERALADTVANGRFELVLAPDARLHDGRSANNAWLQELPDPVTKVAWGNPARVGTRTAAELGLVDGSVVRIAVGGRDVETPVVVLPGTAEGSILLPLGHGRTAAGKVGGLVESDVTPVGCDAGRLRTTTTRDGAVDVTLTVVGRKVELARSQDGARVDAIGTHGHDERLDELVREVPLAGLAGGAHGAEHGGDHGGEHGEEGPHESLWSHPVDEESRRWGMAIDLNACIGCNACAIACQAENNVPVVGAEQVARGRIMHWIRVDRYFKGGDEAPKLRFQPLTCQHCEAAPCEQVCPVAATVHSAEGLNDMVYNRCVGTRYCANNCPFKVRRFNYFNYHRELEKDGHEVQRMLYNPEVTLRARGVMEKCTFCVQRIQAKKIEAKNAGRPLADGEIVTACQQTCPTQAITFGDLSDPKSRVSRLHAEGRAYRMLEELNIRPRTSYLSKVTDENPGALHHGV